MIRFENHKWLKCLCSKRAIRFISVLFQTYHGGKNTMKWDPLGKSRGIARTEAPGFRRPQRSRLLKIAEDL